MLVSESVVITSGTPSPNPYDPEQRVDLPAPRPPPPPHPLPGTHSNRKMGWGGEDRSLGQQGGGDGVCGGFQKPAANLWTNIIRSVGEVIRRRDIITQAGLWPFKKG